MVRHHFRLRNPSTTSLTLTAAFRQLVRSSIAEDEEPPLQDTSTYATPPTTPADKNKNGGWTHQRKSGEFYKEYVALVCPVMARPEGNGAAWDEGATVVPEQEAESSAESTESDLSETELRGSRGSRRGGRSGAEEVAEIELCTGEIFPLKMMVSDGDDWGGDVEILRKCVENQSKSINCFLEGPIIFFPPSRTESASSFSQFHLTKKTSLLDYFSVTI